MGIQDLFKVIKEKCPDQLQSYNLSQLRGLSFAIDVSIFFNKYVKSAGEYWTRTYFTFLCMFKKHGIKSVCVFDGPNPPKEKLKEQESRVEQNDKAKSRLNRAIEIRKILKEEYINSDIDFEDEELQTECREILGTRRKNPKAIRWDDPIDIDNSLKELISRLQKQTAPITDEQRILAWEITQLMGIPVFQADGEAEALCAYLAINGYVDGVLSEDGDTLAYGAPWMFAFKDYKLSDEKVYGIYLPNVLEALDYTMEEFLDLCILLSCDYNSRIKGYPPDGKKHKKACSIGMTGAIAMIDEYRSIENCLDVIEDVEPLIYERCREIFTTFNKEDYSELIKISPNNRKPDFGKIQLFLEENDITDMISLDYIKKSWNRTEIEILEDDDLEEEEFSQENSDEIYVNLAVFCTCVGNDKKSREIEFCAKFENLVQYEKNKECNFDFLIVQFELWISGLYPDEAYFIDGCVEEVNILNKKFESQILDATKIKWEYCDLCGKSAWRDVCLNENCQKKICQKCYRKCKNPACGGVCKKCMKNVGCENEECKSYKKPISFKSSSKSGVSIKEIENCDSCGQESYNICKKCHKNVCKGGICKCDCKKNKKCWNCEEKLQKDYEKCKKCSLFMCESCSGETPCKCGHCDHSWNDGGECSICWIKMPCDLCDKYEWDSRCDICDKGRICEKCYEVCETCGQNVCKVCEKRGGCNCSGE
jgi:5'-3' exonuclease